MSGNKKKGRIPPPHTHTQTNCWKGIGKSSIQCNEKQEDSREEQYAVLL